MKSTKETLLLSVAAAMLTLFLSANALGAAGDLYVSVPSSGQNVVRIAPDGTQTAVTGALKGPNSLAFDAKGILYVAQFGDGTILKIVNGTATPFVSGLPIDFSGLAFDHSGYLYSANNSTMVKIAPDGTKTNFASNLVIAKNIAIDRNDNVFVSDYGSSYGLGHIYKYASTGRTTLDSNLKNPLGLAFDAAGNLYCAEPNTNTIYRYTPSGTRTIFANIASPASLTFDFAGNLIVATISGTISKIAPNGTISPFTTTNDVGGITTEPALSQPLNISTRLNVQTGDNVLIAGFIATGTAAKKLVIRAIGPSLSNFGIPTPLMDPTLELHAANGALIASNDNWKINDQTQQSQQAAIQATGLAPTDDRESALMAELAPSQFTAIVRGKNNTTGVAVVEAYDVNQAADSRLANISTRGFLDAGTNGAMIAGFIVGSGNGAAKVLVRVLGPSLAAVGIGNYLSNPNVTVRDANGVAVAVNDNWKIKSTGTGGSQQAEIEQTGVPPTNDFESAVIATLPNGAYTCLVAGPNPVNSIGVAVVEVYNLR